MYLFRQPRRLINGESGVNVQSAIINGKLVRDFTERLSELMGERKFEEWVALMTYGGYAAAHILCAGYNRILFCTSYDSNENDELTDTSDNYNISGDTGAHMIPIIWNRMGCAGDMYVTKPYGRPDSIFEKAYKDFPIYFTRVDDYYHIDSPKPYKVSSHPEDLFDAVVLLTPKRISSLNNKFKVEDVKKDFAKFCKPNFDLITLFEPDCGITLVGEKNPRTRSVIHFTAPQVVSNFDDSLYSTHIDENGVKIISRPLGSKNLSNFYAKVVKQFRIF